MYPANFNFGFLVFLSFIKSLVRDLTTSERVVRLRIMRRVVFPSHSQTKTKTSEDQGLVTYSLSQLSSQLTRTPGKALSRLYNPLKNFISSSSAPVQVFIYTSTTLSLLPLVIFALWVTFTLLGSVASAGIL